MEFLADNSTAANKYSPDYAIVNGREFGYFVPDSYDPSTPTPLLFMFHGAGGDSSEESGGSAENSYYGWQATAEENGFIVIFPEADGFFNTWDMSAGGRSSDLDYVDDMIDWATSNYNVNTSQIFTTGHSWGAYFSYYVATFRSEDIAAFGAHSGGLGGSFLLGKTPPVRPVSSTNPALNGIILHATDDGLVPYSNSQRLYDELLENGHNVYEDGVGDDGIIEVDGWGPDNHRYRKEYNQTQWDFFMSVVPDSSVNDLDGDGFVDGIVNYQMITSSGIGVDFQDRDGNIFSDESFAQFDAIIARETEGDGFSVLLEGEGRKSGKYRVVAADSEGIFAGYETRWRSGKWMARNGYEDFFGYDTDGSDFVQASEFI